jgi:GT2 family glycosyltransferase
MASKPTVSIIIPNYNYARFLNERFRSIISQNRENHCEIIFLDDASKDDSVALVKKTYQNYIDKLEVNKINSGNPFIQWNRGVRLAQGEYIWIAEADDTCEPYFLERMLDAISKKKSIGLAYCTTVPIDSDGKVLDMNFHQNYLKDLGSSRWLQDFVSNGRNEVRQYLGLKNTITNVSGVLFRREAYVQAGYAPEHMRMCGDWLTYCRLLNNWDVAFVSEPLNYHRQHPTKHTQNSVLDLTYFREFLQVQNFISQAFGSNIDERDAAFNRFIKEWDRLTVSNYGRIGLHQTLSLAHMGASTYQSPRYYSHLAKHLIINSVKSMVSKCFPR